MRTKLRHPVRSIREPFGTAGLIVACVALILALTGAAFAAGKLTSKEKKEVEKIAKKFAGKPGAPGAPGSAGPAGPQGAPGANGTNGKNGTDGKSVEATPIATGQQACNQLGGAEVKQEGAASGVKVCNGQTGFTETLPVGATETGFWNATEMPHSTAQGGMGAEVALSLNVPLASPVTEEPSLFFGECGELGEEPSCALHIVKDGETPPSQCPGDVAEPAAEEGNLCIYLGTEYNLGGVVLPIPYLGSGVNFGYGMGTAGTNLLVEANEATTVLEAAGTFAVTPSS